MKLVSCHSEVQELFDIMSCVRLNLLDDKMNQLEIVDFDVSSRYVWFSPDYFLGFRSNFSVKQLKRNHQDCLFTCLTDY